MITPQTVLPRDLSELKAAARARQRESGEDYNACLNAVARALGFTDYHHAEQAAKANARNRPPKQVPVTVYDVEWYDRKYGDYLETSTGGSVEEAVQSIVGLDAWGGEDMDVSVFLDSDGHPKQIWIGLDNDPLAIIIARSVQIPTSGTAIVPPDGKAVRPELQAIKDVMSGKDAKRMEDFLFRLYNGHDREEEEDDDGDGNAEE